MSSTDYSSLAADSARNSLKRTRELFDRSAAAAFLPSSQDARLYEASQTRRLHTHYSYKKFEENHANKKTLDALVVSTVREDDEREEETATSTGGALVRKDDKPKKQQSTGGILVVCSCKASIHDVVSCEADAVMILVPCKMNH